MMELHPMHGLALFVAAVAGLAVAHRAVPRLPTGLPRLAFILPLLPIFFMLPWTIPIYHLRAILSFIFLWTVPSKLLLLCWDAGIDYPSSGFLYFVTTVMMPIRVKGRKAEKQAPCQTHRGPFWWQFIAVIVILNIYSYRNGLPLWAIYVLYTCHMYLGLELMLGGLAKLATACFGVESDPQFNNPFMSASLSEFWGRRWNLVVTTILRSTVYNPALLLLARAEKHKAQRSSIEASSCTPRTTLASQAPDSYESISKDADVKIYQNGESAHADIEDKQVDEIKNSIPTDTKPLEPEPMLIVQEVQVAAQSSSLSVSYNTDTDCEQDTENGSTGHEIHPSSNSEVLGDEARGINPTNLLTTNVAAKTTTDNPISDLICNNSDNGDSKPESTCSPFPNLNPSLSVDSPRDSFPDRKSDTDKPDLTLPHFIHTPCPNPNLSPQNDHIRKPSLRARTVAMLTRAAKEKNHQTTSASDNADPDLSPEYIRKIEAEGKHMESSGEKPSLRARAVAMLVTFAVSGLVHELIFYYINKSRATGEVMAFFLVHGCATAIEVLLKKTMLAHLRLPRPVSIALTLAFLYATAAWLFMPPLTRYGADINTIAEYQRLQSAVIALFTKKGPSH